MGIGRLLAFCSFCAGFAIAASGVAVAAGPSADSDVTVGTTEVHQEINVMGDAIHYWIRVTDPAGAPPFCVTLELERRRGGRWEGLGIDPAQHHGVRECCPAPNLDESCEHSDTQAVWDLFVYPRKGKLRRFKSGKLRVRGSTDLGPSLALRP